MNIAFARLYHHINEIYFEVFEKNCHLGEKHRAHILDFLERVITHVITRVKIFLRG